MNWFKRLLHKYDDYQECGVWGVYNVETKKSKVEGKMYTRTIKVEGEDGKIGLTHDWITDEEMQKEKSGEWIDPE